MFATIGSRAKMAISLRLAARTLVGARYGGATLRERQLKLTQVGVQS